MPLPDTNPPTPWAEWKADALNRLFQQQGTTGKPARIRAEVLRQPSSTTDREET